MSEASGFTVFRNIPGDSKQPVPRQCIVISFGKAIAVEAPVVPPALIQDIKHG